MTNYEISQLTNKPVPAANDLAVLVDVSDTSTPPAGPAGSDKNATVGTVLAAGNFFGVTLLPGGGEMVMPPGLVGANPGTLSSGHVHLTYFPAQRTESIGNVFTSTSGTAASGLTTAAIGVYSSDGSGNLTLVASVSDLTLWTSSFTAYTRALSFSKLANVIYAVGVLATGSQPPSLTGCTTDYAWAGGAASYGLPGYGYAGVPLSAAAAGPYSSLPATMNSSSLGLNFGAGGVCYASALLP